MIVIVLLGTKNKYIMMTIMQYQCIICFSHLVGPLCEYTENGMSETIRQTCDSYKDYLNSLTLSCPQQGEPGKLVWKPDDKTPDVVYYQVTIYFVSLCLFLSV